MAPTKPSQETLKQLVAPTSVFGSVITGLGTWAINGTSPIQFCIMIGAGLLFWTLVEYFTHRVLFHLNSNIPFVKRLVYNYHGRHHDHPSDTPRMTMSLWFTVPSGMVFYGAFSILLDPLDAAAVFAGLAFGYLAYETVHIFIHTEHFRQSNFMKRLRRHHLSHHHRNEHADFGVTSPLWDLIFGTRN